MEGGGGGFAKREVAERRSKVSYSSDPGRIYATAKETLSCPFWKVSCQNRTVLRWWAGDLDDEDFLVPNLVI